MFSQLGPLFKTVFRTAKQTDARLEIRREEKEQGRKKEADDTPEEESSALWEDSTAVSISALRAFLMQFLQKHRAPAPASSITTDIPAPQAQTPAPVSTVAARAAKAYAAIAAQNTPVAPPPQTLQTPTETPETDLGSLLEAEEIRQIHRIIAELDTLTRTGTESLSIQLDGGTFLDAVEAAVLLQKNGF